MTIHGQSSLQKSIYQLLTGDVSLMNIVSGVFDKVPQRTVYPYIYIGNWLAEDWSSNTTYGLKHNFEFYIWSRQGGKAECAEIIQHIYALLHLADLTLADHKLILLRFISSETALTKDGATYRAVMRFHALTQEIV